MSQQYSDQELDAIAAHAAVATWFNKEGQKAEEIQRGLLDPDTLRSWLTLWMLVRTVGTDRRERLRDFLNNTAHAKLVDASAGCETVEHLSVQIRDDGILRGRATSLVSKFAFALRPNTFVPYDSKVRGALRHVGHAIHDHHYCDYLRAFRIEQEKIAERCRAAGLSPAKLRYKGKTIDNALFDARLADKRLMLEGGFPASRMKRDYKLNDFS